MTETLPLFPGIKEPQEQTIIAFRRFGDTETMMQIPNRYEGYPFAFFRTDEQKAAHDVRVLRCMLELNRNLNDQILRDCFYPQLLKSHRQKLKIPDLARSKKAASYVYRFIVRFIDGKLVWTAHGGQWSLMKGPFVLAWLIPNGTEYITEIHPAFSDMGFGAVDIETPEQGEQFLREWAACCGAGVDRQKPIHF